MVLNNKYCDKTDNVGSLVKKALVQAKMERRIILGLSQIVKSLMQGAVDIPLFCLIAPPRQDDYATHMQEVLLNAYCLENGIYPIQIDSGKKLGRIMDLPDFVSCVLICANPSGDCNCEGSFLDEDYQMTKFEKQLVTYVEEHWDDSEHSTIRLPEK
jgi:ribosomal protein L7Ae-like RNA K-turn-binding protein